MGLNPKSPDGHSAWDYAQTYNYLLAAILEAIQDGNGDDPLPRRLPFTIATDGSGNGAIEFQIPRGVNWKLEGIAFGGSVTGVVNTYANGIDLTSLIKTNPSALFVSDEFNNSDVLTDQDVKLIVSTTGQTANSTVSGNISLVQYDTNKHPVKEAR